MGRAGGHNIILQADLQHGIRTPSGSARPVLVIPESNGQPESGFLPFSLFNFLPVFSRAPERVQRPAKPCRPTSPAPMSRKKTGGSSPPSITLLPKARAFAPCAQPVVLGGGQDPFACLAPRKIPPTGPSIHAGNNGTFNLAQ